MATTRHAGSKLSIKPRRISFPFETIKTKYWYADNALLTTFFAAMSATFPPGEQQFINSVRHYRERITDQDLLEQIRGFIGQEGHHGHQHRKANQQLTKLGLPVTDIEQHFDKHITKAYKLLSPAQQLALTVAAEHLTAVMAEHALTTPEMTEPMHPAVAELVLWHAVEEIEHKSVAFDVYMQCVGDRELLRRTMTFFTFNFFYRITRYQVAMLYDNKKVPSPRELGQFAKFLFGSKGLLVKSRKSYMDFYRKDFHPWDQNNIELVEQWKRQHKSLEEAEAAVDELMAKAS